jgi:putative transposase
VPARRSVRRHALRTRRRREARTFDTVEDSRRALLDSRETYDSAPLIERHGVRPPGAVRQDQLTTAALAA